MTHPSITPFRTFLLIKAAALIRIAISLVGEAQSTAISTIDHGNLQLIVDRLEEAFQMCEEEAK